MNLVPRTAIVVAIGTASIAAHGSDARAAEVVLVPASGGVGSQMPDLPQRVTRVIQQVAARHGLDAEISNATREGVLASAGCAQDTNPCHQQALRALEARKLILVHVTPGVGGAAVDVEIVVATRGESPVKVAVPLMSEGQEALLAELGREADRAFAPTPAPPPGAPPGAPESPEPAAAPPPDDDGDTPPAAATAPPDETDDAADDDSGGGYDFTRVENSTWAIAGASAGIFVVGAVFLGAAGSKEGEVNSARANTLEDFQRLQEIESTGKTLNTIGNTGVLLGLAGLGVAGYLIYREAKVPVAEDTEVSVAPVLAPGSIGVMATVRR